MSRNIKYQFLSAINNCFKEKMDKHAIKKSGSMDHTRVFSFADRRNLVDTASLFSNFMRSNYPDIREIKNITTDHVQAFITSKIDSLSQQSLEQYASRFRKLENIVNSTYHSCTVDFHSIVTPRSQKNGGGKIRSQMLSNKDFQILY